jgi:hypothetical protein
MLSRLLFTVEQTQIAIITFLGNYPHLHSLTYSALRLMVVGTIRIMTVVDKGHKLAKIKAEASLVNLVEP